MHNKPHIEVTAVLIDMNEVVPLLSDLAGISSLQEAHLRMDRTPTNVLQQAHDLLVYDIGTAPARERNGAKQIHTILCPYLQQRKKGDRAKADNAHLN